MMYGLTGLAGECMYFGGFFWITIALIWVVLGLTIALLWKLLNKK